MRRNRIAPSRSRRSGRRRALLLIPPIVLALLVAAAPPTRGAELVPSVGLTRATDADQTKSNVGLAIRGAMIPGLLQSEIGVSYRHDEYYDGALSVKQWPVTASLLLRPVRTLHADAGLGWYHTSYDYRDPLLADETKQQFGVHVGGGVELPVSPRAALDLTGRYGFLRDQESRLVPERFNPDFWTLSLGLALRL